MPSVNPVYSDDWYLGRIPAGLVAPPHTALSLKRCLSGIENINETITTRLFMSASSETPMDDTNHVPILTYPSLGCTPDEPLLLVAMFSGAGRSLLGLVWSALYVFRSLGPTPFTKQYSKR